MRSLSTRVRVAQSARTVTLPVSSLSRLFSSYVSARVGENSNSVEARQIPAGTGLASESFPPSSFTQIEEFFVVALLQEDIDGYTWT